MSGLYLTFYFFCLVMRCQSVFYKWIDRHEKRQKRLFHFISFFGVLYLLQRSIILQTECSSTMIMVVLYYVILYNIIQYSINTVQFKLRYCVRQKNDVKLVRVSEPFGAMNSTILQPIILTSTPIITTILLRDFSSSAFFSFFLFLFIYLFLISLLSYFLFFRLFIISVLSSFGKPFLLFCFLYLLPSYVETIIWWDTLFFFSSVYSSFLFFSSFEKLFLLF